MAGNSLQLSGLDDAFFPPPAAAGLIGAVALETEAAVVAIWATYNAMMHPSDSAEGPAGASTSPPPSPPPDYGQGETLPMPPAAGWEDGVMPNPVQPQVPSGPPPSGSTEPVTGPTMIWTPPVGMSVADYILLAERNNWPIPQDVHASRTRPAGTPGSQPQGLPEEPGDLGKQRENESAQTLANAGYRVRQGPAQNEQQRAESGLSREMQRQLGLDPDNRPDYIIEGRVFDCYAPQSEDVRSAVGHMMNKVNRGQTHRLVVNLQGTGLTIDAIKAELTTRTDRGNIHEIIFIDGDRIAHVLPNQL